MTQLTTNSNQDLFKILVAVAWIDGEIQPEEKQLLEKIAVEQNLAAISEVEAILNMNKTTSTKHCYELLKQYLGKNPSMKNYQDLLSAVSSLIYSDDDIATEEAALLTQIQDLDPQNNASNSTFDKIIAKIQQLYQAGVTCT